MKLISHRGNINGINKKLENTLEYIENAINNGFDCEIDIWKIENELYLGHDGPENICNIDFLNKYCNKLWIHCKNIDALVYLTSFKIEMSLCSIFNCFYHKDDLYTFTSKGYIWGNIDSPINENIICVLPEKYESKLDFNKIKCLGICSDVINVFVVM